MPGGSAHRAGLRQNDKILKINKKVPRSVSESVEIIKRSRGPLLLLLERGEQAGALQQGEERDGGAGEEGGTDDEQEIVRHKQELAARHVETARLAAAQQEKNAKKRMSIGEFDTESELEGKYHRQRHHSNKEEARKAAGSLDLLDGAESFPVEQDSSGQLARTKSLDRRGGGWRSAAVSPAPASDTKLTRGEEKTHLQGLNSRLAGYIDKVRFFLTIQM